MNKKLLSFLLVFILACSLSVQAWADTGYVTFASDGKMKDNFNVGDAIPGLQPGDSASYAVILYNENSQTARWYMTNAVIQSLEDGNRISGGAYSYHLEYSRWDSVRQMPIGTAQVLYDSDQVGGLNGYAGRTGLHEATVNLEDYFFLDTLNHGEYGIVTLDVSLEGESQDNAYQNTMAEVQMNFAVEVTNPNGSRRSVKTGDENNLMPYYIGMAVAGLVFLYLALDAYTDRKYKKGRS